MDERTRTAAEQAAWLEGLDDGIRWAAAMAVRTKFEGCVIPVLVRQAFIDEVEDGWRDLCCFGPDIPVHPDDRPLDFDDEDPLLHPDDYDVAERDPLIADEDYDEEEDLIYGGPIPVEDRWTAAEAECGLTVDPEGEVD